MSAGRSAPHDESFLERVNHARTYSGLGHAAAVGTMSAERSAPPQEESIRLEVNHAQTNSMNWDWDIADNVPLLVAANYCPRPG